MNTKEENRETPFDIFFLLYTAKRLVLIVVADEELLISFIDERDATTARTATQNARPFLKMQNVKDIKLCNELP